ncbi:MAG: hypothetical protein LUH08_00325 [Ruminococcus sp.]|nr:hypothetical protein [Ruminococcus sp.]
MTTHEEYTKIIEERYGQYRNGTYEESNDYLWVLEGPEDYQTEAEMLDYVKKHIGATLKDLLNISMRLLQTDYRLVLMFQICL